MHIKMSIILQTFICIVITLLLSCTHSDEKSSNPKTESSNEIPPQATTAQPTNSSSTPITQVEPEIKDYKGIPWGIDFDKFQEMKKNVQKPAWKGCFFTKKDINDDIDPTIAICLGAPVNDMNIFGIVARRVNFGFIPEKFYSVYDEDIYYIFYDDKFAMAFTSISDYDGLKNKMAQSYIKSDTINEKYTTVADSIVNEVSAIKFKKANESLFLIKKVPVGWPYIKHYLLIIPDKSYDLIKKDMNSLAMAKVKEKQQYEEKKVQKDLEKLR